jgi:hypothetical protein
MPTTVSLPLYLCCVHTLSMHHGLNINLRPGQAALSPEQHALESFRKAAATTEFESNPALPYHAGRMRGAKHHLITLDLDARREQEPRLLGSSEFVSSVLENESCP